MSILNSVLKIFVGDKSKKDVKELQPILDKIKSFEKELEGISLDELRDKTNTFKLKIAEDISEITAKINALEEEVKVSEDIDKNEELYSEIDKLKEEAYTITEKTLNDILPVAFAVVKETAKRFANNSTLTASSMGRASSIWCAAPS